MERSKFLRALGALLMILALVLPVAPSATADEVDAKDQGIDLKAAHLPIQADDADCALIPAGTIQLYLTLESTNQAPIPNGEVRVTGRAQGTGLLQTQAFAMTPGDFENRAVDGQPGSCLGGGGDGHNNDYESPVLEEGSAVQLFLSAPGYAPLITSSFSFQGGVVPLAALGDGPLPLFGLAGCVAGNTVGCRWSLGRFQLQPLAQQAQRGAVSGSVFGTNSEPQDGAVVVLIDAAGQVHTRISGTDCAGNRLNGTGFFCFNSSRPAIPIGQTQFPPVGQPPNPNVGASLNVFGEPMSPDAFDGLGLPIGPATIGVVYNQGVQLGPRPTPADPPTFTLPANCGPGSAGPGLPCGYLISTVTVNVAAGTVTGQNVPLGNKFTPARAATGAGATGYVQNLTGRGVGGITVFACPGANVAGCGTTIVPPAAGVVIAVTVPETGLWIMEGLTAGTVYTFAIAGPGIVPGVAATSATGVAGIAGSNVRPVRRIGNVVTTGINATTGPAGSWIDPNWVVVQAGFPLQQPLPPTGGGTIRGQVTDAQGAPFTGPGALAVLWRRTDRAVVSITDAAPGIPANPTFGGLFEFPIPPLIRAAPIDAGGVYCFGAGCPGAPIQATLIPDEYLVTILDERAVPPCTAGFLAPTGGIPAIPCAMMPATSPPILLTANSIVPPINFTLVPALAPGSPAPIPTGSANAFGFVWDGSVPGGRPVQGATVYAVPVGAPFPPPTGAGGLVPVPAVTGTLNEVPIIFSGPPWVTGSGAVNGPILSNVRAPITGGYIVPPYPGTDPTGRFEILGLTFGQRYLLIMELPQGYATCVPGFHDVDLNAFGVTPLFSPFGDFGATASQVKRCATDLGIIGSGPTALAGALSPWIYGGTFGVFGQNLEPIEPGDIDRRLEHVIPLVSNSGPPAAMGGVNIQTREIFVTNAGPMRTIAEVRFYASDGRGSAAVLAGTQQADLLPGGGRVFRAPEMPGGFVGWAGIWAFDADGPAQIFGQSSLVAVYANEVVTAGGALTETAGISREEIVFPTRATQVPLLYKNYGGTEHKWSSLLTITNMGRAGTVVFQLSTADRVVRDQRRCAPCLITRYVNAGGQININFGDESDPDLMYLPDTTYTLTLTSGGPVENQPAILPGAVSPLTTSGYVVTATHWTVTGKMATSGKGMQRFGTSGLLGSPQGENTGALYAPLLFKTMNRWDSGLALAAAQTSGSAAAVLTVSFYNEDGGFVGEITDRVTSSSPVWYLYLPEIEFIPTNYRGTAIIRATQGSSSDNPGFLIPPTIYGVVQHVNYDRNAAIAYDMVGESTVAFRTDAVGELPCVSVGFVTCAWVADMKKTGAINRDGNLGVQTGIRVMNVDPLLTGAPAGVTINYVDSSGVIWSEGGNQFVVPVFGVHTIFPPYMGRLPDVFRGTARLTSAQNAIVVIANVVDYSVTDRDAAGAYNAQYHNGRTY